MCAVDGMPQNGCKYWLVGTYLYLFRCNYVSLLFYSNVVINLPSGMKSVCTIDLKAVVTLLQIANCVSCSFTDLLSDIRLHLNILM